MTDLKKEWASLFATAWEVGFIPPFTRLWHVKLSSASRSNNDITEDQIHQFMKLLREKLEEPDDWALVCEDVVAEGMLADDPDNDPEQIPIVILIGVVTIYKPDELWDILAEIYIRVFPT